MNRLGNHQVVVLGGGITGCSTAYFLAREGIDVALVEKAPQVGLEASGCNAGGVRRNSRHLAELPLATASLAWWLHFRDELGGKFFFEQRGHIYMARNEAELEGLRKTAEVLQGKGVPIQHLNEAEIRELVPGLGPIVIGANYCPTDGFAEPFQATLFVGQSARRAGATFYLGTRVTGLVEQGGRVRAVQTSRGEISTEAVVSAVGPWSNEIAAMLGTKLPVIPRRIQAVITMPVPPQTLRHNIAGNSLWIHATPYGGLMVGGGGTWEPTGFDKGSSSSSLRRYSVRGSQLFPPLMRTGWLRGWAATAAFSPDHLSIIDRFPGVENGFFAAGCSGHGFAIGPAVGQSLAEMARGVRPSLPIERLSLNRFPPGFDFEAVYQRKPEPL